jgi:hypothetical protein
MPALAEPWYALTGNASCRLFKIYTEGSEAC